MFVARETRGESWTDGRRRGAEIDVPPGCVRHGIAFGFQHCVTMRNVPVIEHIQYLGSQEEIWTMRTLLYIRCERFSRDSDSFY